MKDGDKKNVFTTFAPKADKDRKKLVDMVLKQLRGLSNGTTWLINIHSGLLHFKNLWYFQNIYLLIIILM